MLYFGLVLRQNNPLICRLALTVLTLPYSTACVERTFSMLKDIKDSRRNRLSPESVEACLLIHHELGGMENFSITPDMIQKYSKMWNNSQKTPETKKENLLEIEKINSFQTNYQEENELFEDEDLGPFESPELIGNFGSKRQINQPLPILFETKKVRKEELSEKSLSQERFFELSP